MTGYTELMTNVKNYYKDVNEIINQIAAYSRIVLMNQKFLRQ